MNGFEQTTDTTRPPWKIVALVAGATVLAVALIVGAVLFVRSRQKVSVVAENMDRVGSQLAASLSGCEQEADPEACRKNKVLLAASATGAASVCDQLAGADHDQCVWGVARDQKDATICAAIVDETRKQKCSDTIALKLAVAAMDGGQCDAIADATMRSNCQATIAGPITEANCAERGKDAAYCADLAAMNRSIDASDLDACKAIATEELSAQCVDAIGIPDFDRDGLDADQEAKYGSSDRLADTDGDGYSDAVEIAGGYNPSGPGRLQP